MMNKQELVTALLCKHLSEIKVGIIVKGVDDISPEEIMRSACGYHASVKEHGAPVSEFSTEFYIMGDHEYGNSSVFQFIDYFSKSKFEERIQSLGGLVQKKYIRLQKQDLSQCQPLLFTS